MDSDISEHLQLESALRRMGLAEAEITWLVDLARQARIERSPTAHDLNHGSHSGSTHGSSAADSSGSTPPEWETAELLVAPTWGGGPTPVELADTPSGPLTLPPRYEYLGRIGRGAMGEVYRVLDQELNRVVAMKVLRAEHAGNARARHRFITEAQATAQLEHPGIIPVHDVGRLQDGRLFFTMKVVRGRTLKAVIRELHAGRRSTTPPDWTLQRVMVAFRTICEAMAFAHAAGVIHRDLKPANIMVGEFGEVRILDWGLAKVLGKETPEPESAPPIRVASNIDATRQGAVAGTPSYMAPEQARGEIAEVGPHTDAYALGAILYEIISGSRPYHEHRGSRVVEAVRAGPPQPPAGGIRVPRALRRTCARAMAREIAERTPDAGVMAREIASFLDGDRKRSRARALVVEARSMQPEIADLEDRARGLEARASTLLSKEALSAPVERKLPGWALEDAARALRQEAAETEFRYLKLLEGALAQHGDLAEAHDLLAAHWRALHRTAEDAGDPSAALYELHLRSHDTGRHTAYLTGTGRLSLHSRPSGAAVRLHRFVEEGRRLVLDELGVVGHTPLHDHPLQRGSYLAVLEQEGRERVRVPIHIGRERHWDGVPPGGTASRPVVLPPLGTLEDGDCFIPAGWFRLGGDSEAPTGRPAAWRWQEDVVFRRHPVTNREFIAFLDHLVDSGQEALALRHAPQQPPAVPGELGAPLYGRDEQGHFVLRPDADGDTWEPDWPVVMVDRDSAMAWCDWYAETRGQPWRLPTRDEWEKAGRGVDGRAFPWGEHLDPTFCCMRDSHTGRPLLAAVTAYTVDESPYGVRGLAGNAIDWCADNVAASDGDTSTREEMALICGGSWYAIPQLTRLANALRTAPSHRSHFLGFRAARGLEAEEQVSKVSDT